MPRPKHPAATPSPWVLPAKQQRSMQTRDSLLAAGRALLDHGGFDQTSIAALARKAGCSVGSFYSRFPDKEAFYQAVLSSMEALLLARMQAEVNTASVAPLSALGTVDACIDALLAMFRDHAGLLRTVQRKGMDQQHGLLPLQGLGQALIAHMVDLIAQRYGESGNPSFRRNLSVGFQIAIAVNLNAVLNRPPLLSLQSSDFDFWVREVVKHALSIRYAPPPAASFRPVARAA